jgi:hypothetical protein
VAAAKAAMLARSDRSSPNRGSDGSLDQLQGASRVVSGSSLGSLEGAMVDDAEEEENALSMAAEALLDGPSYLPLSPSAGQPAAVAAAKAAAAAAAAAVDTRIFCCTVGKKPSVANCYVETVSDVEELLTVLTEGMP